MYSNKAYSNHGLNAAICWLLEKEKIIHPLGFHYFQTLCPNADRMAAAQVAKKLKDKRQQRTIEGIFKKVKGIVK